MKHFIWLICFIFVGFLPCLLAQSEIKMCFSDFYEDTESDKDTFNFEYPDKLPDGVLFAVGEKTAFWPNGSTLRVRFIGGSNYVRNKVKQYAVIWSQHANITFKFIEYGYAEIRVSFENNNKSYSKLGKGALRVSQDIETMNFGWFEDERTTESNYRRTIIHEFGHALGLEHEHQNPTAGIRWNKEAVYRHYAEKGWNRKEVDDNVLGKLSRSTTQYTSYDPLSIMHYPIDRNLLLEGDGVDWNTELSTTDIAFIKTIYPKNSGGGVAPPVVVNPPTSNTYADIRINNILGDGQRAEAVNINIGGYERQFVLDYYGRQKGSVIFNLPIGTYPYKVVTTTIYYGYQKVWTGYAYVNRYVEKTLYGYASGTIQVRENACFDLYGGNMINTKWFSLSLQYCR